MMVLVQTGWGDFDTFSGGEKYWISGEHSIERPGLFH